MTGVSTLAAVRRSPQKRGRYRSPWFDTWLAWSVPVSAWRFEWWSPQGMGRCLILRCDTSVVVET
jgi:hypothetical protein